MQLDFTAAIWYWKGPAPFHFITVPEEESESLALASALVSYGWGMIPVTARIGQTTWDTSLFPKDGGYIVPIKKDVQRAEGLAVGDSPKVSLTVPV